MIENPWSDPRIAAEMRANADRDIQRRPWLPHFKAYAQAIDDTNCPGSILEVGCGVGHGREILDVAGVKYRSYTGVDINLSAVLSARERYPESEWAAAWDLPGKFDVVADGSCVLHVDDWRGHLAELCAASRRHVVLHRIPTTSEPTHKWTTHGYGRDFDAWRFNDKDVESEMGKHGFQFVRAYEADGQSETLVFAKPRHFVSYCDVAYLPRLKALHASLVKHAGPFVLHVLAYDYDVRDWCLEAGVEVERIDGFLHRHQDLYADKLPGPPRTHVEQMWSCAPRWVADCMEKTGEPCTYLDADLYALSSPEPMFARVGGAPAGFSGHNFAPASRGCPGPTVESHEASFGHFNVGALVFNDVRVVERWAELCREWCYDRIEIKSEIGCAPWRIFADQGYLEYLSRYFPGIVDLDGSEMVGPWNVHARALDVRDGVPHFGGKAIQFFHFSGLKLDGETCIPSRPEYAITERQVDILYRGYVAVLEEASK